MSRPARNAVLKAKPLVAKKQAKNKHIAQAILRRAKEAAEEARDIFEDCMTKLGDVRCAFDGHLVGAPGWDKECTAAQAHIMKKTLASLQRMSQCIDEALQLALARDDDLQDAIK